MIEEVLKRVFPIEYGREPNTIVVPIERKNFPFAIGDEKACRECHALPSRVDRMGCSEEVLKVDNNGANIAVVHLEKYMKQFAGTAIGDNQCCDYLMTDSGKGHNKIVFCELCCYDERYVEKKQAKARQQMERALEALIQEPQMTVLMLTYPQKVHLFAWRDYNAPDRPVVPSRGDARANMQVFGVTASSMASKTSVRHMVMDHDFKMVKIKYPSTYLW